MLFILPYFVYISSGLCIVRDISLDIENLFID
jgi:hypothetical protein